MGLSKCPGQDRRFWKSDSTSEEPCPHCGKTIEFWKDDPRRRCRSCGELVRNPCFDMGCAKWCQFAEECLGVSGTNLMDETLCGVLIKEMKKIFEGDQRRIRHALAVLDYAELILKQEGGDPLVVKAAAVLHDIGIREAQKKHGSAGGKYQEIEGPPIARRILQSAGVEEDRLEHVCRIIADHHSAKSMDSVEFRIIWDADNMVNIFDEAMGGTGEKDRLKSLIAETFKTETGRNLAQQRMV